ncbi:oligoendopeptidase F [Peribacillus saganii]|uniref:Oligopeptidase F n=1 Tax=Peribacillus saganii TaxID=2303992 RepID=A0A372LN21_9BACI|nr:oligoendopeptidase F [Peribacillus saganii]RFU68004.1 oligoendopeptidase F [Peribacillus saganii]
MAQPKTRDDVQASEKWNLSDIYSDLEAWEKDYEEVSRQVDKIRQFEGNIKDAHSLLNYLTLTEKVSQTFSHLQIYTMLLNDEDTRVSSSQALLQRSQQLGTKLSTAMSFFMPFLLEMDEDKLKGYIAAEDGLKYFEEDLLDSFRYKKHVLSKEQEEILSHLGEALSAPRNTFGMINNADIEFGEVTDDDGRKVQLTRGMYSKLIEDEDREKRKEAYKAYYKPYLQLKNTIASTLSASIKNNVTTSRLRGYPSALERGLFGDKVPVSVYENLISSAKEHLKGMANYLEMRKKRLGVGELRAYDMSVPLIPGQKKEISYEEAYSTMLSALQPLGEEYISLLKEFKNGRIIDVRETKGKRSGAYNIGVYGVHPYVLLNHQDDLDSLFTLVHELGHAAHSYYSNKHQPYISARYSIFVAEVASTVNEVLLIRYLLKQTEDQEMKAYLLNHFIDQFRGTFFTQVMFAEFEKITHEKAEAGQPLNAEEFNKIYESLFRQYNGESLVFDDEVKYGWSRIPHFYRPFYVYKYATGFTSAIDIADRLLNGDSETLENYLSFLKSGGSDYPLELLRKTGVVLETGESVNNALKVFEGLVEELNRLL